MKRHAKMAPRITEPATNERRPRSAEEFLLLSSSVNIRSPDELESAAPEGLQSRFGIHGSGPRRTRTPQSAPAKGIHCPQLDAVLAIIRTITQPSVENGALTQAAHEHGLLSRASASIQWRSFRRPAELVPPCS